MSLCSQRMRELSNPGASGSIFYLTADDEFIIKTVMYKECEFLQKLLPGYYMNLNQNPRTLLPKFFGLFCYQCNSKNIRLCVMNNLLPSVVKMHQKYDLKGSTYKRKVIFSYIYGLKAGNGKNLLSNTWFFACRPQNKKLKKRIQLIKT